MLFKCIKYTFVFTMLLIGEAFAEKQGNYVRILGEVPNFSLVNQDRQNIGLKNFYGKTLVVNFIFTRCVDICPLQTDKMNDLAIQVSNGSKKDDIHFISISVDPEIDTPEVLSEYISQRDLHTDSWSFLTGTREQIWSLSKKGFYLPVSENSENTAMPILHSSQFVIVDAQGRIRGYYDSLSDDGIKNLKEDLKKVVAEVFPVPKDSMSPAWVQERKESQLATAKDFDVYNDFSFTDQIENSEITFSHKIVDDIGSVWKAVHYDHGNGVSIADVDSDGLYDIYFTTLAGTNELWRNLGNGKFEDITQRAGLVKSDRIGVGSAFADIDNDGDQDLYITSVREGNILYENDGKGNFRDITKSSGTGLKAHSSGAVFFDYNRDGLLDLFVSNVGVYTTDEQKNVTVLTNKGQITSDYKYYVGHTDAFAGHLKPKRTETSTLYKNLGKNKFEDVTTEVNLIDSSWTGDATVIDGNQDGWPDLYVLNMQGNDEYYENQKGKKFKKMSRERFPSTPWGAMGVKSFDYDNDGDLDIYVTDMHSDMREDLLGTREKEKAPQPYPDDFLATENGESIFGNAFYRNEGDGIYTEISDKIGAETYWPWGLSTGDFNADGFEDVFITASMNFPFRYSPNTLLLNNRGNKFLEAEYILGVEPRKDNLTATPWFELLCDDRDTENYMCETASGRRVVWGPLGSRSSAIFDLDMDGDLDIVTLEFNQPPMVLINDLAQRVEPNFLKIVLTGRKSNRNGLGATVKVYAGDSIFTKVHDGKSGYLAQSVQPLYFGLGEYQKIKKIEVIWPSGKRQRITKKIAMNTLMNIKE